MIPEVSSATAAHPLDSTSPGVGALQGRRKDVGNLSYHRFILLNRNCTFSCFFFSFLPYNDLRLMEELAHVPRSLQRHR